MLLQWCSSRHNAISFREITLPLFFLLIIPKQNEGKLAGDVIMYPNADDQVLDEGATLNLTCIISMPASSSTTIDALFNISWTLPYQSVNYIFVRNISVKRYLSINW